MPNLIPDRTKREPEPVRRPPPERPTNSAHVHDWELIKEITVWSDKPELKHPIHYDRVYECQDRSCKAIRKERT